MIYAINVIAISSEINVAMVNNDEVIAPKFSKFS